MPGEEHTAHTAQSTGGIERSRTRAPSNRFGETMGRFSGRLDASCDNCGHDSLDQWITEGATETAAVCPPCGHVHDDARVREFYEEGSSRP